MHTVRVCMRLYACISGCFVRFDIYTYKISQAYRMMEVVLGAPGITRLSRAQIQNMDAKWQRLRWIQLDHMWSNTMAADEQIPPGDFLKLGQGLVLVDTRLHLKRTSFWRLCFWGECLNSLPCCPRCIQSHSFGSRFNRIAALGLQDHRRIWGVLHQQGHLSFGLWKLLLTWWRSWAEVSSSYRSQTTICFTFGRDAAVQREPLVLQMRTASLAH